MQRLIDADALKESIDEHVYLVHHGFNETEYGCTQYGIHQIIDDAQTIDAVPQWIPCSERLPDRIGRYLVYSTTIPVWKHHILNYDPEYDQWFWDGLRSEECDIKVLAWMPLPEPYEGDKK